MLQKAEDIFADMGIERRNISKQSKMRVQKRIELKGNVSSRFVDDTDTNDIDDEGWGIDVIIIYEYINYISIYHIIFVEII